MLAATSAITKPLKGVPKRAPAAVLVSLVHGAQVAINRALVIKF